MILIIRMFLSLISFCGYILYFSKKIWIEFAAGFVCSSITGVLFLSGILNLLPQAAVLVFIGGLICLAICIKNGVHPKDSLTFGIIFLIISGILLFFQVYGSRFVNYDTFIHWGATARVMIRENRFPNQLDKFIGHKTYPVGTACWIYYWMFISGNFAEHFQIFVQNFLFLCMSVSLFPLCRNLISKLLTAVVIIMLMCGNQDLFSLQVDNILMITTLSAIAFIVYFRNELKDKYLWLSPWCVFLVSVKSSGLLFVFFIFIMLVPRIGIKKACLPAGISAITYVLWIIHTELVFKNAAAAKHSVSLTWYKRALGEKNYDDIVYIFQKFMTRELAYYNRFNFIIILAGLMLAVYFICRFKLHIRMNRLSLKLCNYAVIFYLLHEVGLFAVYVFSMPLSEATGLASYPRYHAAAVLLSSGILLIAGQFMIEDIIAFRRNLGISAVLILFIFLLGAVWPNINYLRRQDPETLSKRNYYEEVTSQIQIPDNKRIMNFTGNGEDPLHYCKAFTVYYFAPSRNNHITPETFTSWDQYDYIFVLTDNDEARHFVEDNAPADMLTIVMK